MTRSDLLGARLALWWCDCYTQSADAAVRDDRRDELSADVHDQMALGRAAGIGRAGLSHAVLARTVRGIPADLLWRFQTEWARDCLRSLLSQPETILGSLFLALVPLTVAADVTRSADPERALAQMIALICVLLYTLAVAYALSRVRVRPLRTWRTTPTRVQVTRGARLAMYSSFALSGIWRFAPYPLSQVSAWAWLAFGVTAIANAVLLLLRLASGLRRGLDLGKVPS